MASFVHPIPDYPLDDPCVVNFFLTVVDDVMIHEMLQKADGSCSIRGFLMAHKPVYKFMCYKAVGIGAQVVAPVLDEFSIMKPHP